jgi:hypothetical protein
MPPAVLIGASVLGAGGMVGFGMSQQASAQKKALSAAEDEKRRAKEEQARLEGKYGTLTPEEEARSKANYELATKRQAEYERRAGLTGEQLIAEEGDVNKSLIEQLKRRQGMSGEELFASEGELNRKIGQEALSDDPNAMLSPELEIARQSVNAEANRRGVFGGSPEGGIRFEQLGRANVDLAIKAASQRIAQRNALANAYLTLGANQRSESGTLAERSLSEKERARAELQSFLSGEQNLSEAAKGRTTNAGFNAAQIGEAGNARAFDTSTSVFGQRAAAGQDMMNQGLSTLGQLGGNYLSGGLTSAVPKTSTGLTDIRGTDYNSVSSLRGLSGSYLEDQLAASRR